MNSSNQFKKNQRNVKKDNAENIKQFAQAFSKLKENVIKGCQTDHAIIALSTHKIKITAEIMIEVGNQIATYALYVDDL